MTHSPEPAYLQAAALISHWERRDIEAIVVMLADLGFCDEAGDLVVAMLRLRDRPEAEIAALLPPGGW